MKEGLQPGSNQASSSQVRRIHEACLRFEAACKADQHPRIEDFLLASPEPGRAALLRELLGLELAYRCRKGDTLALKEYQQRFPDHPDLVLTAFREEVPLLVPHSSEAESSRGSVDTGPQPAARGDVEDRVCVGRYRITGKLGSGSFGAVYKAYDDQLQREVAIKIPHPKLVATRENAAAYLKEARSLASLDHPGIVPIYDVGQTDDGTCYLVSKFVPGKDLMAKLHEGRLPHGEAVEIIARVAEALHYAHQRGLVHRDIKPANILLDAAGRPVVADFGLALRQEDYGTGPGFAGTPAYMSPEQARSEGHRVDARTDVYSVGVVFYELLTGQRPFRDDNRADLLEQIKTQEPRPPRQLDDRIPKELDRICLKALCKRARDRYSTAIDLAEDLRHWQASGQAGEPEKPAVNVQLMLPQTAPPVPASASKQPQTVKGDPQQVQLTTPGPRLSETRPSDSDQRPTQVVPKGLRSFDAEDADFFLELLPGPRDREGLPESIRFWKRRIESADPDRTFHVGLLYGPSGCGKSSLVRAGLLPRLSEEVLAVYIEATANETEARLLNGLRKRCPLLPAHLDLKETLAALRRGQGIPPGKKVLIILDQFEQWLHARGEEQNTELVQALRQCDGDRVQCLVMVRDDFWMAVTRFMGDLEIRLVEGQNSAAVDLFDVDHAKKVLAAFGRAYGRLPESTPTKEVKGFLHQAASGLAQEGRVVCVRLALWAEMMKGKPWTPAALKAVGGTEGVGVTFLEETFSAGTAPPGHRLHQKAARSVLKALLPETGTEIKGHMQSYAELLDVSGYASRPKDFDDLLRILDREICLITPTDPKGREGTDDSPSRVQAGKKYYELTHDYLVPALRKWLTRKQRETWRGRAELRLAERAALWSDRRERRQLPSWWEWSIIVLFTRERNWSQSQRRMMRKAGRHHGLLACALLVVVAFLGWSVYQANGYERGRDRVKNLLRAKMEGLPESIAELTPYRRWTDGMLVDVAKNYPVNSRERLNVALALGPADPGREDPEFQKGLWGVLEGTPADPEQPFRAACCLAGYDPHHDTPRWQKACRALAAKLVKENPLFVGRWKEALRPIREDLVQPLGEIFRNSNRSEPERSLAANLLANYAINQPVILADLIKDAEPWQGLLLLQTLTETLKNPGDRNQVVAIMEKELNKTELLWQVANVFANTAPPVNPVGLLASHIAWHAQRLAAEQAAAPRRANAAVALLQLGKTERAWPLFRQNPKENPALRTYLIHRAGPMSTDPDLIIKQVETEQDVSAKRAVILCLGEFADECFSAEVRAQLVSRLMTLYRGHSDAGVHSATEWLLRRWGHDTELRKIHAEPGLKQVSNGHDWYVNREGQTMAIIPGPVNFWMGSPDDEPDRRVQAETLHRERIPRSFAIGTKKVTIREFRRFLKAHPQIADTFGPFGSNEDAPMTGVTWFQAVQYCRWLSDQERLDPDQMCYPSVEEIQTRFENNERLPLEADYLRRTGYRLPTEAEWEYACRAGSRTTWFFGSSEEMLPKYAWYLSNSKSQIRPVGLLKPNDFGLFDIHGNATEWTHTWASGYSEGTEEHPHVDEEEAKAPPAEYLRMHRGGAFLHPAPFLRSAARFPTPPDRTASFVGFRVARTHR